jgi:hypothetical protein
LAYIDPRRPPVGSRSRVTGGILALSFVAAASLSTGFILWGPRRGPDGGTLRPARATRDGLVPPVGNSPPVGQRAPDFSLPDGSGRRVSLASFRDRRPVVLIFGSSS